MRGCFLRPLLQPACGLIATTMSADSSSPSPLPHLLMPPLPVAVPRRGGKRQRPRNPAPAATTPDAASAWLTAPHPHPVLEQLAGLYPHLFGAVFRPLKRGYLPGPAGRTTRRACEREALLRWRWASHPFHPLPAGRGRWRKSASDPRQPAEAMAPEHVHHALLEVYRRRKNQKGCSHRRPAA